MRLKDKFGTPMTIALVMSLLILIYAFINAVGFLVSLFIVAVLVFLLLAWISNEKKDDPKDETIKEKNISLVEFKDLKNYFIGGAVVSFVLILILIT